MPHFICLFLFAIALFADQDVQSASFRTVFQHDSLNRVTDAIITNQSSQFFTTTYEYDELGNIIETISTFDSDSDGDGLPDNLELRRCTSESLADSDGDTYSDYDEYYHMVTDPCLIDTDGDGLNDNLDNTGCLNPVDPDSDGDGLADGAESNEYGTSPCLTDSDGDGLGDYAEVMGCTDPLDQDTDDDGIKDNDEVTIYWTNPCNPDTDGDRVQDGTEIGLTLADVGPDTDLAVFEPDTDPTTTTNPRDRLDNNTIRVSGTLTAPDGPVAIDTVVIFMAATDKYRENIPNSYQDTLRAGQSSLPFSLILPDDLGTELYLSYHNLNQQYLRVGYYEETLGTSWDINISSSLPHTEDTSDISLELIPVKHRISGFMPWPAGLTDIPTHIMAEVVTPTSRPSLGPLNNEYTPEGINFTIGIPDGVETLILHYLLDQYTPGLVSNGFYHPLGSVSTWEFAQRLDGTADHTGVVFPYLTSSHSVSGTLTLPNSETAGQDLSFNMSLSSLTDGCATSHITEQWGIIIPQGQSSAPYSIAVPDSVSDYIVDYTIQTEQSQYVTRAYYGPGGSTGLACDATKLANNQDQTGIDFTLTKGKTLSGTVVLPEGYSHPDPLRVGIVAYHIEDLGNGNWTKHFITDQYVTIPVDAPSISYSLVVPDDVGSYVVSYYFQSPPAGIAKEMFYSTSGMVAKENLATLLPSTQNNSGITLEIQEISGNSLSGSVLLPSDYTPSGDMWMAVVVYQITPDLNHGGWDITHVTDHWFTFFAHQRSMPFEIFVPDNAGNYVVSYTFQSPPSGITKEMYYAETGMVYNLDHARQFDSLSPHSGVNIILQQQGEPISGTVSLPGAEQAAQDIEVIVQGLDEDGFKLPSTTCTIPAGSNSVQFSCTFPAPMIDYKLQYLLISGTPGYMYDSYYSDSGPSGFESATILNSTNAYSNINLELRPSTTFSGTASLAPGLSLSTNLIFNLTMRSATTLEKMAEQVIFLPSFATFMAYTIDVPQDAGDIFARYEPLESFDLLTLNGLQSQGYFHETLGTTSFQSKATILQADAPRSDVNITLLAQPQPGDYNLDGSVDLRDVIIALKVAIGESVLLNPDIHVDANGDGSIGLPDALYIMGNL